MGTPDGEVVGLWVAESTRAHDGGAIQAVLYGEDLLHLLSAASRRVPNIYNDRGGVFVMFGRHRAPGERGPE